MSTDVIRKGLAALRARAGDIATNRAYFDGDHGFAFLSPRIQKDFGKQLAGLCDNLVPNIVEATVDRLEVTGFVPTDPQWQGHSERAWDIWQRARMDSRSAGLFRDCGIDGLAGALTWVDSRGRVTIFPQRADTFWGVESEERPGELTVAMKRFRSDFGVQCSDVYRPHTVETWHVPDTSITSPVAEDYRLLSTVPNPLGAVPGVLFGPGVGEVKGVLRIQNLLNRSLIMAAVSGETHAWPILATIGLAPRLDEETGERAPWIAPGPARVHELPGKAAVEDQNVDIIQITGPGAAQFLSEAESYRAELARLSRTPSHMLLQNGNFPSGAALKTAESGFVGKIKGRQKLFGPNLADLLAMAVQLELLLEARNAEAEAVDGDTAQVTLEAERPEFETRWAPAHYVDELDQAKAVETWVAAGVSLETALVRYAGWDQETAAAESARKSDADAAKAAAQLAAFDAGPGFGQ